MQKILFSSLWVLLFSLTCVRAQNDLSSMLLTDSWQQLQTNPARQAPGIVINLPGVYNNLWLTNITFNDLLVERDGQRVLDINNAIAQMDTRNLLRETFDLETLGVGIRLGKIGIQLGHRMRFDALIDYPKTLAQLIWQGNAQFIGQTVDFGPSFDLLAYHEIGLGVNYAINDKIQLGGRLKLLSGAASLTTPRNDLQLTTSDDVYQLLLDADLLVNNAGSINYDGLRDISTDFNFGNFDAADLFGSNTGLALDLGVHVDLGKVQISASAIDLGAKIEWTEGVQNYTLADTYEFEGLDVAQSIFDDAESFGSAVDTLYETYEPVESSNSFQTTLGSKLYLSAQYEVTKDLRVGLIGFQEDYRDLNTLALAISGSYQLGPLLQVGGFCGLRNERLDNLGVNAQVSLGPVRLLLATDNIITAFRPKDAQLANFRLGLNLRLGKTEEDSK
jgi:hypothetical protein